MGLEEKANRSQEVHYLYNIGYSDNSHICASGWPGADNPVTLAVGECLKTPGLASLYRGYNWGHSNFGGITWWKV